MEAQYYLSSKIITFENEMIQKTNLKLLLPIELKPVGSGETSKLKWTVDDSLQSLTQLLKSSILSINLISQLIADLSALEDVLEHHLLDYQNILYTPEMIYYDGIHNHFKFCYLPIDSVKKEKALIQLMYYLLICGELAIPHEKLKDMPTTPKSIASWFEKNSKPQKEPKWLLRFLRLKSNQTKDKPITAITKHPSNNSMLMDKSNPQKFYKLYFESNVIGRDDTSNVQILEDSISRKHCVIYKENVAYRIKDLDSRNGTWINGTLLRESVPIVNGDIIQLGEKEFIFIR